MRGLTKKYPVFGENRYVTRDEPLTGNRSSHEVVAQEDNILSARNIHRRFPTSDTYLPVLRGLNLEVRRGEVVAVTGESGVGKSTLLHILGGLDRPTEGEVVIDNISLTGRSEKQLAAFRNEKVGFVFQFHYLLEDFTAHENVMIPLLVAGKSRAEAGERAEHLLDEVGLADRMRHRPTQLSGGEQQRVAVARALANDPRIVLADEPSGNLDIKTGHNLHNLLFELNRSEGISFLIATHNPELASACGRHLEIVDGVIRENRSGSR